MNEPFYGLTPFLSRDPMGEWGSLNLYGFVVNDPVGHYDTDGRYISPAPYPLQTTPTLAQPPRLLEIDELEKKREALELEVRKICCKCDLGTGMDSDLKVHIDGFASGATVTEDSFLKEIGCIDKDLKYFWWNCADAQSDYANAGSPPGNNKKGVNP